MKQFQWEQLVSSKRIPPNQPKNDLSLLRSEVESDYYRIINSASFRRLQDKTQVFPLDQSDFVRTRLTHSMEVSAIAKLIGRQVCAKIKAMQPYSHEIIETLASASLIHDLGNPPFGHFGETAIRNWFKLHLDELTYHGKTLHALLKEQERCDLMNYEGNAQSLRIVNGLHHLHGKNGMHLTSGVLDTIIKYPCNSLEARKEQEKPKAQRSLLKKKIGYYASEATVFQEIKNNTGTLHARNPLTYILEAADDLAYTFSDLEDGYNKGLFTTDDLKAVLLASDDEKGLAKLEEKLKQTTSSHVASYYPHDGNKQAVFSWLTLKQLYCISAITDAFVTHYDAIMEGRFEKELIAVCVQAKLILNLKTFAFQKIYNTSSIIQLELMGNEIISYLMDCFVNALLPFDSETETMSEMEEKYVSLLSHNYMDHYFIVTKDLPDEEKVYHRLLMAADFIGGMTDHYAKTLYQRLRGINL